MNDDIDLAAHEDERGAEANDRELRDLPMWNPALTEEEPSDIWLVGAIMARIGWEVDDLATPDHVAVLVDQTREDLAPLIRDIDKVLLLLGTVRDEVAQSLARLMEDDEEPIAGMIVSRSRSDKVEWDKDGCWRASRHNIYDRWARADKDRVELIDRTLADIETAFAITPRVGGLKAIGVNPHEFRAVTRGTRYSVKVRG